MPEKLSDAYSKIQELENLEEFFEIFNSYLYLTFFITEISLYVHVQVVFKVKTNF